MVLSKVTIFFLNRNLCERRNVHIYCISFGGMSFENTQFWNVPCTISFKTDNCSCLWVWSYRYKKWVIYGIWHGEARLHYTSTIYWILHSIVKKKLTEKHIGTLYPIYHMSVWVLIMFGTAEPRHFEMQKYPHKRKYLEKKDCFT